MTNVINFISPNWIDFVIVVIPIIIAISFGLPKDFKEQKVPLFTRLFILIYSCILLLINQYYIFAIFAIIVIFSPKKLAPFIYLTGFFLFLKPNILQNINHPNVLDINIANISLFFLSMIVILFFYRVNVFKGADATILIGFANIFFLYSDMNKLFIFYLIVLGVASPIIGMFKWGIVGFWKHFYSVIKSLFKRFRLKIILATNPNNKSSLITDIPDEISNSIEEQEELLIVPITSLLLIIFLLFVGNNLITIF